MGKFGVLPGLQGARVVPAQPDEDGAASLLLDKRGEISGERFERGRPVRGAHLSQSMPCCWDLQFVR